MLRKMVTEKEMTLSALKFLCGNTDLVCRLCFTSLTEKNEVAFITEVNHNVSYCKETVNFYDMFHNLGVPIIIIFIL